MTIKSIITSEIKTSLKEAWSQITTTSPTKAIDFTPNFYIRAKEHGLSEKHAEDVFYNGLPGAKPNQLIHTYGGYEIGIYFYFNQTGNPVITTIWKKDTQEWTKFKI